MTDPTIRAEHMAPFFSKFHLEGVPGGPVLHRFTDVDHGDPHDHPWGFTSLILFGGYDEEVFDVRTGTFHTRSHHAGEVVDFKSGHVHRIVALHTHEVWTLILPGIPERKSGFYRFVNGHGLHRYHDEPEFQRPATFMLP